MLILLLVREIFNTQYKNLCNILPLLFQYFQNVNYKCTFCKIKILFQIKKKETHPAIFLLNFIFLLHVWSVLHPTSDNIYKKY